MKIKISCGDVCFDWYEWRNVEINTSDFDFFSIEYRLNDSWHLEGVWFDKQAEKFKTKELSKCQISFTSLAEFLCKVDKPIVKFVNLYNSLEFQKKLFRLLKLSEELKEQLKNKRNKK